MHLPIGIIQLANSISPNDEIDTDYFKKNRKCYF